MGEMGAWVVLAAPFVLYGVWELYGIWLDTRPNKMKAVFFDNTKKSKTVRVNLNADGKTFNIKPGKKHKYHVVEAAIYRTGTWRVPTSYYFLGKADPIDQIKGVADATQTAEAFFEATESNVARQIIESFSESFITITTSMLVVMAVVVIANAILYVQFTSRLDEIATVLGIGANGGG